LGSRQRCSLSSTSKSLDGVILNEAGFQA